MTNCFSATRLAWTSTELDQQRPKINTSLSKGPVHIPSRQQLDQHPNDKRCITFSLILVLHRDTAREVDRVHTQSLPSK